jgi:hypothetical protein
METACLPANQDIRTTTSRICGLIRECYLSLQLSLRSPYVDGSELYDALVSLGHGAEAVSPGSVTIALGPKGLALPVANLAGKPKHYLPAAVAAKAPETKGLSGQVEEFADHVRKFARPA